MIAALAKGAAVLQEPHYLDMAQRAMQMIETHPVNDKGRLLARFRDGEANFLGYLDDYAFLIWALHELYTVHGFVQRRLFGTGRRSGSRRRSSYFGMSRTTASFSTARTLSNSSPARRRSSTGAARTT